MADSSHNVILAITWIANIVKIKCIDNDSFTVDEMSKVKLCTILQELIDINTITLNTVR